MTRLKIFLAPGNIQGLFYWVNLYHRNIRNDQNL